MSKASRLSLRRLCLDTVVAPHSEAKRVYLPETHNDRGVVQPEATAPLCRAARVLTGRHPISGSGRASGAADTHKLTATRLLNKQAQILNKSLVKQTQGARRTIRTKQAAAQGT